MSAPGIYAEIEDFTTRQAMAGRSGSPARERPPGQGLRGPVRSPRGHHSRRGGRASAGDLLGFDPGYARSRPLADERPARARRFGTRRERVAFGPVRVAELPPVGAVGIGRRRVCRGFAEAR